MTTTETTRLEITPAMIDRTARDWSERAGEPIKVEAHGTLIYGFGSELATLRLFRKFNMQEGAKVTGRAGHHPAPGWGFYFVLEVKF